MSTALITNPASDKQISFLRSLFEEAQKGFALAAESNPELVERLTPDVARVQHTLVAIVGNQPVDKRDASEAISTLKFVSESLRSLVLKATLPPGLASINAERVIVNKFANKCAYCDVVVDTGAGHAVKKNTWFTVCTSCANETEEQRKARIDAERDAARARVAAEQAERQAHENSLQSARTDVRALSVDLFNRAGVAGQSKPDVHVAIDNVTGSNDLDFYRVVRAAGGVATYRILGGHNDQRLNVEDAVKVLERLACTASIPGALAAYGREIGRCGRCHRSLTDEGSRAAGLGPECASKIGF